MAKGVYIGVDTPIPIYETAIGTVNIDSSNLGDYFSIENSPNYPFTWNESGEFISTNAGADNTESWVILKALVDMTLSFNWALSTEYQYDKFYIGWRNGDHSASDVLLNYPSGTESGTISIELKAGEEIELLYTKDHSQSFGTDAAWIKDIVLDGVETTVITGYEYKDVARKVKKAYVGIQQFEPRELPEGYTQVEYIESSGSQYVDTGVKPNNNTRVVMDYNLISGKPPVMFGAMDSWVSKGFAYISNEAMDALTICYGANFYTPTANAAGRHIIDANKNVFSLDGMVVQTCTEVTFQSNYNLILFGYNNGGTVTTKNTIVYIHSCQIYDNGTIVRDYVPCTNSSGVGGLYDLVNKKFYGNSGTGTFAVGGSATSTARKVKKGYIGIGGVARPFMSGGELAYYGTITGLSSARYNLAATTVGNYALFGGGEDEASYLSNVDAYNKSLTRTVTEGLSKNKSRLAATTVGDYAIFTGGSGTFTDQNANAFDTSLTLKSADPLSTARYDLSATTVGNYAIFAGGAYVQSGESYTSTADAYDNSLTRTTPTLLSYPRRNLAATTVGDYALFGGGDTGSTYYNPVDAYNASLTRTDATRLNTPRYNLAATTVGNYAIFAGGMAGVAQSTVDGYDASLTRITVTDLSLARGYLAATTVGDYALFGGGQGAARYDAIVDVYDASLTRTTATDLNTQRCELAATTVGNYALFGGGRFSNSTYHSTVDAFVVA